MPDLEKLEKQKQEILGNFQKDYPEVYGQLQNVVFNSVLDNPVVVTVNCEGTVNLNGE